jgi:uncharacterized protein YbjT (DUF2867 family)
VNHIAHLSSFNVLGDPMPAMGRWHHEREAIIRASGISVTFLRPGGFMTNALDWAPTIREAGYVLDPIGSGRYAPIDPADIAAVAALALTEDGHQGKEYVLTGDEAFTVAEQVRILAEAIGRDIEVRQTATPAEAVRSRFPAGAPPRARGRHHGGVRSHARRHRRFPRRHCGAAARTLAAQFRALVPAQRRRVSAAR